MTLPIINAGGMDRKLGALFPPASLITSAKRYSAWSGAIDTSSWKTSDLFIYNEPIRNQLQHGSCTGHAGVNALENNRRQEGQDPAVLSCTFPYAQVNGGRDNGASVTSVLQVLQQMGTCTQDLCDTDTVYKYLIQPQAYTVAKKYLATESFLIRTYTELCDAINRGFFVAFGISVGENFSHMDSNGVCPLPDTVVGGHALCGGRLKQDASGTWLTGFVNSWGESWGQKGYAWLTQGHFTHVIDAYAIMASEIVNPPPIVVTTTHTPEDKLGEIVSVSPELAKKIVDSWQGEDVESSTKLAAEEAIKRQPLYESPTEVPIISTNLLEELKAMEAAEEPTIEPVPQEVKEEKETTPSDVHVDPEKVMQEPFVPKKKNRHKH